MTGEAIDRLNRLDVISARVHAASESLYRRMMDAFAAGNFRRELALMDRWLTMSKRSDRVWAAINSTLKG